VFPKLGMVSVTAHNNKHFTDIRKYFVKSTPESTPAVEQG